MRLPCEGTFSMPTRVSYSAGLLDPKCVPTVPAFCELGGACSGRRGMQGSRTGKRARRSPDHEAGAKRRLTKSVT